MAKINILDPSVFNMIAAGEVVERPASVVKELVENAIDAGATHIDITIENGGLKLIHVIDDGIGIEKDDIRSAFLPHATSKLEHIRDLETLSSLGFRGEALASIASIAEVTLSTRTAKDEIGNKMRLVGGKVVEETIDPRSVGTSIKVENLFFNTPARLKFMKTPTAEERAIISTIEKIIFANPSISVVVSDEDDIVFEHEGGDLKDAVCSIWGAETFEKMVPIHFEKAAITVNGYISKVEFSKPTRSWQAYIVNGRAVENKDLVLAVDKAYEGRLVKHNYPFCVLDLIVPFDEVDVNVHPRKSEVRFRNKNAVFGAIYRALNDAFNENNVIGNTSFVTSDEDLSYGEILMGQNNSAENFGYKITNPNFVQEKSEQEPEPVQQRIDTSRLHNEFFVPERDIFDIPSVDKMNHIVGDVNDNIYEAYGFEYVDFENKLRTAKGIGVFDGRIIGQMFDTYLVVERDGFVYLIDQHAAHERILYNKLQERLVPKYVQPLLIPHKFKLAGAEADYFEKMMPVLNNMGFEIGKKFDNYFIYAVPDIIVEMDFKGFLSEFFKNMLTDKEITVLDIVKEKICQTACKSAIKGGDRLNAQQIQDTVMSFLDDDGKLPDKCPHGRPAVIRLSKTDVEKMFKRIV